MVTTKIDNVSQLKIGQKAKLGTISDAYAGRDRLAEMGFLPGTGIEVMRKAPFGDPIQVRIRGSQFAIRMADAKHLKLL